MMDAMGVVLYVLWLMALYTFRSSFCGTKACTIMYEGTSLKIIAAIKEHNLTALSAATGGHPGLKNDSLMQQGLVEIMWERLKSFVGDLFLFTPVAQSRYLRKIQLNRCILNKGP